MKFKARTINKNGKNYLQLNKTKMTFNTTRYNEGILRDDSCCRLECFYFFARLFLSFFLIPFSSQRLSSNFTNLFNGNKALGQNIVKFMNENWKEILDDLKQTIVDGFGNVFSSIINHVFSNFPYEEMFA